MKRIRSLLPLSEKGFASLRLGILANAFRDLCAFLPFVVIWRLMDAVLRPITDGTAPDLARIRTLGLWGVTAADAPEMVLSNSVRIRRTGITLMSFFMLFPLSFFL